VAGAEPAARTIWLIPCTCRRRGRVTPAVNHPHPGCQMTPTPEPWGKTGCHRLGQPTPAPRHKRESSVRPRPGTRKSCRASTARQAAGGPSGDNSSLEETPLGRGCGPVGAERRAVREGGPGGRRGPLGKKHGAKRRAFGLVPTGSNLVTETGQRGRLVAEWARDCWFMSLAARRAGYLHSTCYLERPSVSATEQSSTRPPITEAMLPAWPAKVCAGANSR